MEEEEEGGKEGERQRWRERFRWTFFSHKDTYLDSQFVDPTLKISSKPNFLLKDIEPHQRLL
jgi:hypothetical protein